MLFRFGRAGANVRIVEGDWYAALPESLRGTVDVIVANPPYIARDDTAVEASVVDYEPHRALYAGNDGLDAIRTVIGNASAWLRPKGVLVCEIGHGQGDAVRELMAAAGLRDPEVRQDLSGRDRIALARSS